MFVAHCQLPLIRLIILWMSIFTVNASKKVVLLDTANSPTELRWKTHSNMDEDEIGWLEETYRSSSGLENRRAYVVCNVEHPDVDNWLRTPRIERQGANRLHVETTFTMRDCSEFPGNARTCKETFRLYAAQVNGNEELPDVWEEDKWELIGRITADIGRHSTNDAAASAVNQDVHSFTVTKDVVYFAFRDSGACVSILNVKIFYEMCPEITRSFVRFPQTTTGAEAHSIIAVPGKCVSNASPLGVVKQPTYVCKATGSWDMLNGECVCNPGFVASVKHNTCTGRLRFIFIFWLTSLIILPPLIHSTIGIVRY
ncbi:hypothetical protein AB6A40_000828 [Gnathostoma spinigerum]|uniref:Eph LBD domain-containing protein n=1 Tax=Gnathostoma spinigerum TaxID=75299 RepID=A0ABD6E9T4_9BILA